MERQMKLNEALSLRLKELCRQYGLTAHGLAIKSGVASSTIGNIIKMRCSSAQLKFIAAVCDGPDISLREFFSAEYFEKGNLED